MTALDFRAWDKIVDICSSSTTSGIAGFDGMYGTVARWIGQIQEWNPRLTEQDCFTVLKAWLGRRFAGGKLSVGHGFGIPPSLL